MALAKVTRSTRREYAGSGRRSGSIRPAYRNTPRDDRQRACRKDRKNDHGDLVRELGGNLDERLRCPVNLINGVRLQGHEFASRFAWRPSDPA